ncbi:MULTISPECIES: hypothetical protein [Corallincola]|uniref:Uncharacterized protein n=2 Tax=Corallincola TaxID=1775176 RepID=A0ABY1WNU3_9GAMM|nr:MULTISPECIES: hypothetical protein [Corallincola]TAA45106.1 hypothetical protein EXY25_12935 [Corallincola spongiicola]TCI03616.1 hypothetical protein EZV61_08710 [Corallincola luteus]
MNKLSLPTVGLVLLAWSISSAANATLPALEAEYALAVCTQALNKAFKEPLDRDRKAMFNLAFDVCRSHQVDVNMAVNQLTESNTPYNKRPPE